MKDPAPLDELERYLVGGEVLDTAAFDLHGAHKSYRLILEGAVGALAKPADEIQEGDLLARHEAAAWVVARLLGWGDLLAATVLRRVASFRGGDPVDASVQVLWPDCQPDADAHVFPDDDVWRAGAFDAVVGQSDRSGHNWLAVPTVASPPRLKLIDHGYCFPPSAGAPSSTFYEMKRGGLLPTAVSAALRTFVGELPGDHLPRLLPADCLEAVRGRAQQLVDSRVLQIP